jgi:hypothetical protein
VKRVQRHHPAAQKVRRHHPLRHHPAARRVQRHLQDANTTKAPTGHDEPTKSAALIAYIVNEEEKNDVNLDWPCECSRGCFEKRNTHLHHRQQSLADTLSAQYCDFEEIRCIFGSHFFPDDDSMECLDREGRSSKEACGAVDVLNVNLTRSVEGDCNNSSFVWKRSLRLGLFYNNVANVERIHGEVISVCRQICVSCSSRKVI